MAKAFATRLKDQPDRQFRLIHRYHQTSQAKSIEAFKDYPGPFDFSFKYSVAHMYSGPNPTFIEPVLDGDAEESAHLARTCETTISTASAGATPIMRAHTSTTFPGRTV